MTAAHQVTVYDDKDDVSVTRATWSSNTLRVWATRSSGDSVKVPTLKLTVSVDGSDNGMDRNVAPFVFEAPMTFNASANRWEYQLSTTTNLLNRRVVVQSNRGGVYGNKTITSSP